MWSVMSITEPGGNSSRRLPAGMVRMTEPTPAPSVSPERPASRRRGRVVINVRGPPSRDRQATDFSRRSAIRRGPKHRRRKAVQLTIRNRDAPSTILENRRGRNGAQCRSPGITGVRARIRSAFFFATSVMRQPVRRLLGRRSPSFTVSTTPLRSAKMHESLGRAEFLQPLAAAAARVIRSIFSATTATPSAILRSPP